MLASVLKKLVNSLAVKSSLTKLLTLLSFCDRVGVRYRLCGKLIVATGLQDLDGLDRIERQAQSNPIEVDLQRWSATEVARRFPNVHATAALWCAATAVIDSHGLMRALSVSLKQLSAILLLGTTVDVLGRHARGWLVGLTTGGVREEHEFDVVVNAAGHGAQAIAAGAGVPAPAVIAVKGNYYVIVGESPADALIYPVPAPHLLGLGVHLTVDMAGVARLGPDTQPATSAEDTAVDSHLTDEFLASARRFLPGLRRDQLRPDFAGVRPKLAVDRFADFHIEMPVDGFVQLSGIESPGLTACLAIASYVAKMVRDRSTSVPSPSNVVP